jgi:tetrahydromethanopterin S-methyltransferase subunit G
VATRQHERDRVREQAKSKRIATALRAKLSAEDRKKLDEVHQRVFNGLGKELREEVGEEVKIIHRKIGTLYKSIGALLIALLMIFAGIIIEGRIASNTVTEENNRNYKAIVDIAAKLEIHLQTTAPSAPTSPSMIPGRHP